MAFDTTAIRTGMATKLAADVLGDGNGWIVHDTYPGDTPLPALVVEWPDEITYNETLRGTATGTFTVVAIASLASEDHAQQVLNAAMSWPGIVGPLQSISEADPWRSLRVVRASNVRNVAVGQSTALAFDLTVEITA